MTVCLCYQIQKITFMHLLIFQTYRRFHLKMFIQTGTNRRRLHLHQIIPMVALVEGLSRGGSLRASCMVELMTLFN